MQEISSNRGNHPRQLLPGRPHFIWLGIMAIVVLVSLLAVTLPARGASIIFKECPWWRLTPTRDENACARLSTFDF